MFETSTSAKSRSTQSRLLSLAIHVAFVFALLMVHFAVETGVTPVRNTRVLLVPQVATRPMKRLPSRTQPKAPRVHARVALPPPRLPSLAPPVVRPQPVIEAPLIIAKTP